MRKILSASIVSLAVFLSSTAYAETEIWGGFSVKGIEYSYDGQASTGSTPRCSCDIDNLIPDCPVPWFLSSVDQGQECYDQWSVASAVFVRSIPGKGFEVKNGNARFPNPNTGIILMSTSGKCFLITVDDNGALHSSQTGCL